MSGSLSLQDNPTLEQIEAVQAEALRLESEIGVQIPTWHHFADGLVARTIFVPAGVVAFGAAHKFGQINICQGDLTVYCEGRVTRYTGFNVIPSGSGAKRQGLAHSDTWSFQFGIKNFFVDYPKPVYGLIQCGSKIFYVMMAHTGKFDPIDMS